MQSTVSVIIPNLNSRLISLTLEAMQRQTFDLSRVEVIVAGRDELGLVARHPHVRMITASGRASAAHNRNLGMAASHGDLLCFTDADCVPQPDWLSRNVAHYQNPTIAVVGGGVDFEETNYWAWCDNLSWFHEFLSSSPSGERRHLPSLNLSVRRSVIEQVGPFDESYPVAAGEDTEWTQRMRTLGVHLHFDPQAVVVHAAQRHTIGQLWQHAVRYGQHSPKIVASSAGTRRGIYGKLPRRSWQMLLLAPLLASVATGRVLVSLGLLRSWRAVPGLWLSKLGWCVGASRGLARQRTA